MALQSSAVSICSCWGQFHSLSLLVVIPLIYNRDRDKLHLRYPYIRMSSVMSSISSSPSRAGLTRFWKISFDPDRPNGSLFHQYLSKGVAKVVKRLDSSWSTQYQYPAVRSVVEKDLRSSQLWIELGSWCVSLFRTWFNGRGSMHILRAADFFVTLTTLLTHAVCSSTFANTPRFSEWSSSALNLLLRAVGICCAGVMESSAFSSTLRWTLPGRAPRSLVKTSG